MEIFTVECAPGFYFFVVNAHRFYIVALGGAGLSDEQREEMTNREGVAAGGATEINSVFNRAIMIN